MNNAKKKTRFICETHKIKPREDSNATFYVLFDHETDNGADLGFADDCRILYKHAKAGEMDTALVKISDLVSHQLKRMRREIARLEKALQGRA